MFALICWLFSAAAKTLLKPLVVSNARLTYRISQAFVAGSQVGSEIVCASSSTLWRNTKWTAIVLGILAWIFWQTTHYGLLTDLQVVLTGPVCWITHCVVSEVVDWAPARARRLGEGPTGRTAEPEPPGVADAREAPGGDGEVVWRATPAGVFRTWIGQTPAECESLEHMHLDLEQEMEEEERECARLRKTTWVPGSVDDEVSDWTAPALSLIHI